MFFHRWLLLFRTRTYLKKLKWYRLCFSGMLSLFKLPFDVKCLLWAFFWRTTGDFLRLPSKRADKIGAVSITSFALFEKAFLLFSSGILRCTLVGCTVSLVYVFRPSTSTRFWENLLWQLTLEARICSHWSCELTADWPLLKLKLFLLTEIPTSHRGFAKGRLSFTPATSSQDWSGRHRFLFSALVTHTLGCVERKISRVFSEWRVIGLHTDKFSLSFPVSRLTSSISVFS